MLPDECLRHFGLSAEPFEMPSLAEDFWPHPQMHVVAGLVDKTIRRAGFLLVQGPSGCGKTAITRYAVGNLVGDARRNIPRAEGYHVARLLTLRRRTATGCALPRALLRDFAPGVRPRSSAEDLVDQVASMIATKYKAGQNCTVVIEEAHELSADLWLDLKKLREICDEAGGGLGVICVGQTEGHPNLDETLDQPDLVSVRRRVFVCEIRPLSPGQARKYVEHRLARAGARVGAVLPEAIEFLLKYLAPGGRGSTGMALYPALLDTWIGRAMVQAWDKGARSVGAAIMSYCLKTGGDVAGGEETPESRSHEVTK
jgi:general secretion pathway protein A